MPNESMIAGTLKAEPGPEVSWLPLIIIVLAQILMIFNISSLQVSIEGIASSFGSAATAVGTAIVTYSLVVAGLILLGAKAGQRFGARRVFRATVAAFGVGMALMTASPRVATMIVAQVIAGAAAAGLVPTLVVLTADTYRGGQQEKALGWLAGAQGMGIVVAFLTAGALSTWAGWRYTFGLLAIFAAVIYKLSERLPPVGKRNEVNIDWFGASLAATAVLLISLGANNLTHWGLLLAGPGAPFSVVDMSPAPIMILCGIFLVQAFFAWSAMRQRSRKATLVDEEVLNSGEERSAAFSLFIVAAVGSAITFLIPLYIQVVQGRSGFQTAIAVVPYSLASFAAAVLVVRLYSRLSPRRIARYAFLVIALGVALLAVAIRNQWGTGSVVISMVLAGAGEGALVTLLFNVLVTASPKHLAGDVGSLRGTTNNLASGVGTALASALLVGLLSTMVHRKLVDNAVIPNELKAAANLDDVRFISNAQLNRFLGEKDAAPQQIAEAGRINTEARIVALKVALFTFAGLALLAFFSAAGLPDKTHGGSPNGGK